MWYIWRPERDVARPRRGDIVAEASMVCAEGDVGYEVGVAGRTTALEVSFAGVPVETQDARLPLHPDLATLAFSFLQLATLLLPSTL